MPEGSLSLHVTDLLDQPLDQSLRVDLIPHESSSGGEHVWASLDARTGPFELSKIPCNGGVGTLYRVRLKSKNHKLYQYFQRIVADKLSSPSDGHVWLVANPKRVNDIAAPAFSALEPLLKRMLAKAEMIVEKPEDKDLKGSSGQALYAQLDPMRKACLLNIHAKASHVSAAECFEQMRGLFILRRDRLFCEVDTAIHQLLGSSKIFDTAPSLLHDPPKGYELFQSFKSKDPNANLQVTLLQKKADGTLAADVDIDEASGIRHGFEVIRNAVGKRRTNPYLVRELLLLVDPTETVINPNYDFIFR